MAPSFVHYLVSDAVFVVIILVALWIFHGKIAALLHLHTTSIVTSVQASKPTVVVHAPAPPAPAVNAATTPPAASTQGPTNK